MSVHRLGDGARATRGFHQFSIASSRGPQCRAHRVLGGTSHAQASDCEAGRASALGFAECYPARSRHGGGEGLGDGDECTSVSV